MVFFFVWKAYQKPKIVTKRPPVSTTVYSGTNAIIGALVYTRVYIRIYDPGQSNPTNFLELCYRYQIEFPMSVPTFNSTLIVLRFILWEKKLWYLAKSNPLTAELIYLCHLSNTPSRLISIFTGLYCDVKMMSKYLCITETNEPMIVTKKELTGHTLHSREQKRVNRTHSTLTGTMNALM